MGIRMRVGPLAAVAAAVLASAVLSSAVVASPRSEPDAGPHPDANSGGDPCPLLYRFDSGV